MNHLTRLRLDEGHQRDHAAINEPRQEADDHKKPDEGWHVILQLAVQSFRTKAAARQARDGGLEKICLAGLASGKPRGVTGHQIDLEIDVIARMPFPPGRDL